MRTAPTTSVILWILAIANFAIGMGAFVVIGVLVPISDTFQISHAAAGWVLTLYAIIYAVFSPIMVAMTGDMDRKRLLTIGLGLFLAGAIGAVLAPSFATLLATRCLMALGGGIVSPVAASVAVALVEPEHRGRALSTVFAGLTLSQVFGVPLGAWVGYTFGWVAAFQIVVALTLISLAAGLVVLPRGIVVPRTTLKTLGRVLVQADLVTAVSYTAFFMAGQYSFSTYMAPFLEDRLGLARDGIAIMFILRGIGAVVGNTLGGWATDRIGSMSTLVALSLAQIIIMPLLTLIRLPLVPEGFAITIWSVVAWSFMVPQQARLAALDPARMPILLAINASFIYVGSSIGTLIGGASLEAFGFGSLGLAASLLFALALGSVFAVRRLRTA